MRQPQRFARSALLLLVSALSVPMVSRPANAQGRAAVVVVGVTESSVAEAEADALRAALTEQGVSVVTPAELRDAYALTGTPPAQVSAAELAELRANRDEAVRALARGRAEVARERIAGTLDFLTEHIESLARTEEGATEALDHCLTVVRALERRRRRMRAAVTRCRQLFPNAVVEGNAHPPEIRRAFARTIDTPRFAVIVRGERDGCRVRVNGRPMGETPATVELPAGPHRAQVECDDQVGRVHLLEVDEEPVDYTARAPVASVRETPDVTLRYLRWDELDRRIADASQLGAVTGVGSIYLVSEANGQVTVERIEETRLRSSQSYAPQDEARVAAFASLDNPAATAGSNVSAVSEGTNSTGDVTAAADTTSGGALTEADVTATGEPTIGPTRPERTARRIPSRGRTLGFIGLALSAGAIGGAVGFFMRQGSLGDEYASTVPNSTDFLPRQRDFRNARVPVYALAGAGAGIGMLSVMLALPRVSRIPWWSWLVGGVGVGLAIAGGVFIGIADDCGNLAVDRVSCVARQDDVSLGAILMLSALPFLTVPIQFLIQRRLPESTSLSIGPQGVSLTTRF